MPQLLLFADPRPLVERFGVEFFQRLPQSPGVYLMRDANSTVLYLGKAKNLRKRLNSYRVANPERVPRRHLRLLRAVVTIDLELCPDESAAIAREAELLLALKPKFNRAGTYLPPPRFLNWRADSNEFELRLADEPEDGFEVHGPMKGGARFFYSALARLVWWALHPNAGLLDLPFGWIHGRVAIRARIPLTHANKDALNNCVSVLRVLLNGDAMPFSQLIQERTKAITRPIELALREADLEMINVYCARRATNRNVDN